MKPIHGNCAILLLPGSTISEPKVTMGKSGWLGIKSRTVMTFGFQPYCFRVVSQVMSWQTLLEVSHENKGGHFPASMYRPTMDLQRICLGIYENLFIGLTLLKFDEGLVLEWGDDPSCHERYFELDGSS